MHSSRFQVACIALLSLLLTGCGGTEESNGPRILPALTVEHLPGVYVMDLERTLRGDEPSLGGHPAPLPKEGDYRLELREDGTFSLDMGSGEFAFALQGTWSAKDRTIRMRTTVVNGEPADEETSIEESMTIEGRRLVVEQQGRQTFLRRLEEGPLAD